MKLDKWLASATKKLLAAGVGTARLDSLILLEDEVGKDRSWVLAHPEHELSTSAAKKLDKKVTRRTDHEPLAYIRGFTEFYGRKFKVNKRVLEPRPESEAMIDLLKQLNLSKKTVIADIGTGSGALGITTALELHNHNIDLYDIDAGCLAVAKHNCALHELHLQVYKRDLLNRPVRSYDVLLANLPYVPTNFYINQAAAMEPRIAIHGGSDGLDVYRGLFEQMSKLSWKPQYIFTESLPPQHTKLASLAAGAGYELSQTRDFIQLFIKVDSF